VEPRVIDSGPTHALVLVENVYVFTTNGPPTAVGFAAIKRHLHEATRMHPDGFAYLQVAAVGAERGAPEEDVRRGFIGILRAPPEGLRASAVLILRSGFAGAAVRMVASGILLAARTALPVKVFSTLDDASAWLIAALEGTRAPTAAAVEHAVAVGTQLVTAAPSA
jgi:hypothetical protein